MSQSHVLGTIVSEFDNPAKQTLILKNWETNQIKEYPIEDGKCIRFSNRRIPTSHLLSKEHASELERAHVHREHLSFILTPTELTNVHSLRLPDFIM